MLGDSRFWFGIAVGAGGVILWQRYRSHMPAKQGTVFLIPLGVMFGGYQLVWYGFSLIKGPGMGFLDLLLPTRVQKAQGIVDAWGTTTSAPVIDHTPPGVILDHSTPTRQGPTIPRTGPS